jgi:hypothetical protein
MNLSVLFLVGSTLLGLALHISQYREWWKILLYSCLIGAVAYFAFPFVLEINLEIFRDWVSRPDLVKNLAVWIVAEAFLLILLDWSKMKRHFGGKLSGKLIALGYFPGSLWVCAVLFVQILWLSSFPGQSFELVQAFSALGLAVGLAGLALFMRWGLPMAVQRYELKYLVHLIQIVLAGVMVASLTSYSSALQQKDLEWLPLLVFMMLLVAFWAIGLTYYKIKNTWK